MYTISIVSYSIIYIKCNIIHETNNLEYVFDIIILHSLLLYLYYV